VCALVGGLLWPAYTRAGITVSAAEGGCPGREQVVAALEARLPGVTGSPGPRLELEPRAAGVALRLREPTGALALERQLAVEERGATRAEGCQALAEAAALVVTRYLRELGVRSPSAAVEGVSEPAPAAPPVVVRAPAPPVVVRAPAPPARPWSSTGLLGVAGAARVGAGAGAAAPRGELLLGLAVHARWLAAELGGGASSATVVTVPEGNGGQLRLRGYPLRAALGLVLPVPGGALVPTAGVALELLSFRASGLADARSGLRLEPAVELGASYLVTGRHLSVRLRAGAGRRLAPRDFEAGRPDPVFRTADGYFRADLEVGLVLWKNDSPSPL
jgi:hypothetical protein